MLKKKKLWSNYRSVLGPNFLVFSQLYKLVHNTGHIPTLSICSLDFEFSLEHVSKHNTVSTKVRVL